MGDPASDLARAREGLERSRQRRRRHRRRRRLAATWKLLFAGACAGGALGLQGAGVERQDPPDPQAAAVPAAPAAPRSEPAAPTRPRDRPRRTLSGAGEVAPPVPRPREIREATAFAARRSGLVAFAVIGSDGEMHGFRPGLRFPAASVAKAPLLAARLRVARSGAAIDQAERDRLAAMIRWSDNDAADAVYARVGDAALIETARRAGMRGFEVAGHWGNAQLRAVDGVRFIRGLGRILGPRELRFAKRLLASIVPEQRWGIPAVATSWRVWMKGGWTDTGRGELASQVALLERGKRRLAIAVLTDAQPSQAYAQDTVAGVTARLLGRRR